MKQILFSAAGTSDPVRNYYDGPLMHIVRNYRPDEIYILLTKEMANYDDKDHRFAFMENFIKERWEGYSPKVIILRHDELVDPSNIDLTYEPLTKELYKVESDNPDSEILLNLSSGTPAIKFILFNETMNTHYKARGIAVSNPESKSGSSDRTNREDYHPEIEFECNEDEFENSKRCYEPQNIYLRRALNLEKVKKFLEDYDYPSALVVKDDVPTQVIPLIELMSKRLRLDTVGARSLIKKANVDFNLFPTRKASIDQSIRDREDKILEYFLVLKKLVATNQLAEFLFRLNPLLVAIDAEILATLTEENYGLNYKKLYLIDENGNINIPFERIREAAPPFYEAFRNVYPFENEPGMDLTLFNLDMIFSFFELELGEKFLRIHEKIVNLNQEKRNPLAHNLTDISLSDFQKYGLTPNQIIDFLEETMLKYLHTANKDRFDIYHRVNDYLLDKLNES